MLSRKSHLLVVGIVALHAMPLAAQELSNRQKAERIVKNAAQAYETEGDAFKMYEELQKASQLDPGNVYAWHVSSKFEYEQAFQRSVLGTAVRWLESTELYDGGWRIDDPEGFPNYGNNPSQLYASALASLALASNGRTHRHSYRSGTIENALRLIWAKSKIDGDALDASGSERDLQAHIFAALVFGEIYAISKDESLKPTVEALVRYLVSAQDKSGGWRRYADADADVRSTVWAVIALSSARRSEVKIDRKVVDDAKQFLHTFRCEDGMQYGFKKGEPHATATAMVWCARALLGETLDDDSFRKALQEVADSPFNEHDSEQVLFRTQVAHICGGAEWDRWKDSVLLKICERQVKRGREAGSWFDKDDPGAKAGGRLEQSCFHTLSLNVYYRHLPIFRPYHARNIWDDRQPPQRGEK